MLRFGRGSRRAIALGVTSALLAGIFATPVAAAPLEVRIHEIQGDGSSTPLNGQDVTVEAVVVGDFQGSSRLRGFFLQEEDADADGDPATSEGIFVLDSGFGVDVQVGDRVEVTGTAGESFRQTQISSVDDVDVISSGVALPSVTALVFALSNAEREAVEGMLVSVSDVYVTDTFNLHRRGEVWLGAGGVIEQPTNELPPGPAMEALAADNMLHSILLDDGSSSFSSPSPIPYLNSEGTLRVGDREAQITAVVGFGLSEYRLHPVEAVEFESLNDRPDVPNVGGKIKVASFNVLNYWTTLGCRDCRGASNADQFAVQTEKLVAAITAMGADIVALQEIENPVLAGNPRRPSHPAHTPIRTLVDALNDAEGKRAWAWVGPASHYNDYPIRNEIIYRIGTVRPVGRPTALAHPAFDAHNPDSGDAYGRPPLAQRFQVRGSHFTVVVNHLKSKSSPCGEPGEGADGQGNCNLKRLEQAAALLDFVEKLQLKDPDVLVVGDMNAYMEEDPIRALETELTNLVTKYDADPYSYNFFAMFAAPFIGRGSLDHAFATPSMAQQVTGTATWHINADEPRFLDWFNPATSAPGPYRSSDHDPVLIGVSLDAPGKGGGRR